MLVCDAVAELLDVLDVLAIEARFSDFDAFVGAAVGVIDVRGTRLERITGAPRQDANAASLISSVSPSIKLRKQSCSLSQLEASA